MDETPPTPPVVETGALHPQGWDGVERRRSDPIVAAITHAVKQAPKQRPPDGIAPLVRDIAIIALNLLTLIIMFKLAGDIDHNQDEQKDFRDGISCFLVDSVQHPNTGDLSDRQRAATEMLIRCGFIETPGNGG